MSNKVPRPEDCKTVTDYKVAEISICVTESKAGAGPSQVFNFNYASGMQPYVVRVHTLKNVLEVWVPDPKHTDDRTHACGPESHFFANNRIVWIRQKFWDPAIHEVTEEDTDGDDARRESEGESKEALDETRGVLLHAEGNNLRQERDTRLHNLCSRMLRWGRDKGWIQ